MTTPTNREAVEQIKNVISGYLMDISKGHITATGAWSFPNEEQFDIDVANAIRQTHLDLLGEVEREVIGEDGETQKEWSGTGNNFGIRCQNNLKHQQRQKLSHIITRVEGKGLND